MSLKGKVCVVTGATRGIGRGTAIALAEQGAIIYVSGRTTGSVDELTIEGTVAAINAAGGEGHGMRVDHANDSEIADFFEHIGKEQGKIDILVNNVYKIPSPPAWGGGFWDHPIQIWDDQVGIGLRAHYVASWHAATLLFAAGAGSLIVNVSSPGGQSYHFSSSYGAGKAGLDRLTADMAIELKDKEIAAITLYPGSVATEFILASGRDPSGAQTTLGVGRTVAALAQAPDLMSRSGSIQWVEDLSKEFDVRDENGNLAPAYPQRMS
ncbi:MAG: SDR family NAD(P)-dependent oxidoreductase [Pseudomonadales bacterium]|jgi:dehydrogenase/reductase SDR family protein 1